MKKVLHVINGEHYSGAERVQDLLGRFLPQFGYHADFATLMPGKFIDVVRDRDYRVDYFPMHGRLDLRPAWRLATHIRREGYELIHAHSVRSALVSAVAAALTGVPLVLHVHSPSNQETHNHFKNMLHVGIERLVRSKVCRFVCVSDSLARKLLSDGLAQECVTVVKNGIWMPEKFPVEKTEGEPDNDFRIGMVALVRPRKGMEVLLDALHRLRQQHSNFICRVIGPFETESYEHDIRKLVDQYGLAGHIKFLGFRKDVYDLMCSLDVLALPSLYGEGIPMVAIEAMALGVPVVSTSVEGLPELIPDRHYGLLCEPGDADAFSEALDSLINDSDLRQDISRNARIRQREMFSEISMAGGVANVYADLLTPIKVGEQE